MDYGGGERVRKGRKIISKVSIERYDLEKGDVLEIVSTTKNGFVVARNLTRGEVAMLSLDEFEMKEESE
jgi:hypothetical protein